MILSGQLGEWSVADLLQILRITQKTASLKVEHDGRFGIIHFRGGKIVGAEMSSGAGGLDDFELVVETVYVIQTMAGGYFTISHDNVPEGDQGFEIPAMLESAAVLYAEEQDLSESGLMDARALRVSSRIEDSLTVSVTEWPLLVAAIGRFTFADLEASLGRSRAVSVVSLFRRLGVLEAAMLDAVSPEPPLPAPEPGIEDDREPAQERRREMRSIISPVDTTLVPGVLSDIRQRFRVPEQDSRRAGM